MRDNSPLTQSIPRKTRKDSSGAGIPTMPKNKAINIMSGPYSSKYSIINSILIFLSSLFFLAKFEVQQRVNSLPAFLLNIFVNNPSFQGEQYLRRLLCLHYHVIKGLNPLLLVP